MSYAYLALADGRLFRGKPLGAIGRTSGEVVFNTSLTGYQEILSDPSYAGQMVTMTYPLIGNYGMNDEDDESRGVFASGFIVKEESKIASNWRLNNTLGDYLRARKIVGIQDIDTRALTRHIRKEGAMPGVICSDGTDIEELKKQAATLKGTEGMDLAGEVSCKEPYQWSEGLWSLANGFNINIEQKLHVVAVDLGVKRNILRNLANMGARVTVVPAKTSAADIMALNPDGVFLSNGPGDPSAVANATEMVGSLLASRVKMFGICLGHQILCRALGANTYKLKFGHHGGNQPVVDLATERVEITAQNHNYAVDETSLPADLEVTHRNLNDNTVEGVRSKSHPVFSVQYHPEAAPGPHDSAYLFDRFAAMMSENGQ